MCGYLSGLSSSNFGEFVEQSVRLRPHPSLDIQHRQINSGHGSKPRSCKLSQTMDVQEEITNSNAATNDEHLNSTLLMTKGSVRRPPNEMT